MSNGSGPSDVLASTTAALASEAERLERKAKEFPLEDEDFKRLMAVHRLAGELEQSRSEALLVLLGARTNVKDMTPEALATLANAVTGNKAGK